MRLKLKTLLLLAGCALFLAAMSWLPYHVAVEPSQSLSYLFGYNNKVGELLVGLGIVLLLVFGPELHPSSGSAHPLKSSTLVKALAGTFAVGGVLVLLTRKLEGINESIYFIDRIHLVLDGKIPYRDFEFAYGPLFLYGPAWMVRLLHISVGDAYGAFWLLLALLGVYLLFKTILWVDELSGRQRPIFLSMWVVSLWAMANMGVNYSMFRFILPGFLGLAIYRRLRAATTPADQARALLLPVPFLAFVLLDSPEQGIAFGIGVAVYLVYFGPLISRWSRVWFTVSLIAMVCIFLLAARAGLFITLNAVRRGGLSFPIVPAPNVLMLYLCIGLCACYAGARLRSRQPSSLLMLIAVSVVCLPAALGRCDPGHTLLQPFGISLAACFLASGLPRVARGLFLPLLLLVFMFPTFVLALPSLAAQTAKEGLTSFLAGEPASVLTPADRRLIAAMSHGPNDEVAARRFAKMKSFSHLDESQTLLDVYDQPQSTVFEAPFHFAVPRFGNYHSPFVYEGYFMGDANMVIQEQVTQKIAELSSHPRYPLLIPFERESQCRISDEGALSAIKSIFHYPYDAPAVHTEGIQQPLCDYIVQHYRLSEPATAEHFGYAVWLPK